MAEAFGIATGALQAADTGLRLYTALNKYVKDYKHAEKDVKRISNEVKTAAWALKQLGTLLQEDQALKRTKPDAISEASTALSQCNEAFSEVNITLQISAINGSGNGNGIASLSLSAKLK